VTPQRLFIALLWISVSVWTAILGMLAWTIFQHLIHFLHLLK
jgi:hypothetical protein